MSVAVVHSRALAGMEASPVTVEAHLANGLPCFTIVGLPETEVKEAKDRVRAALQNARPFRPADRAWHSGRVGAVAGEAAGRLRICRRARLDR
jgi:hypothetical protein